MDSLTAQNQTSASTLPSNIPQKPINKQLETIFFNPTLKVSALRIAILASAAVLACAVAFVGWVDLSTSVYIATLPTTLVHHLFSAFRLRFVIQLLDLILLIAEVALLIKFNGIFVPDRYAATSTIVLFVAIWWLVSVLLFLLICRIAAIIRHKGKRLLMPFDFLEDSEQVKGIPIAGIPAAYSILISRSIWRTQFVGEGVIVRLIRGAMAGIFITALIGYGVLSLVVKPVQETALTPVKESRGVGLPANQFEKVEKQSWNFVFTRPIPNDIDATNLDSLQIFYQAVNVTPLWEGDQPDNSPPCERPSIVLPADIAEDNAFQFQDILVQCGRREFPTDPDSGPLLSDILPDILIEVDYALLGIMPNSLKGTRGNTIGIFVGLTSDTTFLTSKMAPLILPPNSHYLVGITPGFRRVLKRPALSGFGMFEGTDIFSTAEIQDIVPDPLASARPIGSTHYPGLKRGICAWRLFSDWWSVDLAWWKFAMIFGTSLMRIFFGSKSLSIFGIAQQLEKDSIARAYLDEYPKIRQELKIPEDERGMMALLQDHMIDVGLFQDAINETSATGNGDEEKQGFKSA